jgi:hypothetical protein
MRKIVLLINFFLLFDISHTNAQQFNTADQSIIKPSQVIIDNYTVINLSKEIIDNSMANRFDLNNPYTYLQIVKDENSNSYHILFQTSFEGKILFLSYSNNLSALFNKKEKPMFLFTRCLKEINNQLSSIQVINAAVKCIVERLNYCSDN